MFAGCGSRQRRNHVGNVGDDRYHGDDKEKDDERKEPAEGCGIHHDSGWLAAPVKIAIGIRRICLLPVYCRFFGCSLFLKLIIGEAMYPPWRWSVSKSILLRKTTGQRGWLNMYLYMLYAEYVLVHPALDFV